MFRMYARTYQAIFKVVSTLFVKIPEPILIEGPGSLSSVPALLMKEQLTSVMIVTDKGIVQTGLMDSLLKELQHQSIRFVVFDEVKPNPTIEQIETALSLYNKELLKGVIAIGGGSPIDLAKAMLARHVRPKKSIPQLKGVLKVGKKLPLLIAVPTTSGTGSEATLAAVVTNLNTLEKYAINDPHLVPKYAILDPLLTMKLPKHLTATTGMDALTHAVEAYIGYANTLATKQASEEAVRLIYKHIGPCVLQESNIEARSKMQKAAYLAGYAFTRAYVGNIHAIAHTLGGFYNVPHGLANAVLMPVVLRAYGKKVHIPLAKLADLAHVCGPRDSTAEKAEKFIQSIEEMNLAFGIPRWFEVIQEIDIPKMATRANQEANPLYPVPVLFRKVDFEDIYRKVSRKAEFV
ncbi:MAG: iron-containing alcohol dehydrogenase [bacterium]|nr:iron-containing alcohol dehydrogenase [bacterium]